MLQLLIRGPAVGASQPETQAGMCGEQQWNQALTRGLLPTNSLHNSVSVDERAIL